MALVQFLISWFCDFAPFMPPHKFQWMQLMQGMQDNPEELEKMYNEILNDPNFLEVSLAMSVTCN